MPVFDATQSKIKMVILTKHKIDNRVWWSPINQNKRPSNLIVTSMIRRFKKDKLYNLTNVLQFYENGKLIAVEKL